ncbi:hypothetical protein [Haloarchaeobius amylolyticus]|uniref:hypothetical protein n=1 Tax=Haloarchaeobius amylolyticus TaxID=1198296 RepID=UPI002271C221|nr:hypothetical protein [Haloarchaeobius amylolyticus]
MATRPHVTADYRCSECGGRVGATSRHCMHCEVEFGPRDGAGGRDAGDRGDDAARLKAALTRGRSSHAPGDDRLGTELGTSVVGVLAALVLGPAAFLATIALGWVAFPIGLVAFAAGGFLVAREDSLRDAVGLALQLLALPVLVFPLSLALSVLADQLLAGAGGTVIDNLLGAAMATLFLAVVWLPLLVLGRWLRR